MSQTRWYGSRKRRTASLKAKPSPDLKAQTAAARNLIKNLEINNANALEDVNSVVEFCQSTLNDQQSNRGGTITKLLLAAKAKLDPILRGKSLNNLPQELLADIFECATEDDHCSKIAFAISHVNQMWRALALRLPRLWAHLSLSGTDEFTSKRLAYVFERSINVPLKVSVAVPDTISYSAQYVVMISQQLHAVRSRIVWLESSYRKHMFWQPFQYFDLPEMEYLDLPEVEYVAMRYTTFLCLWNVPKLRHLHIQEYHNSSIKAVLRTGATYNALRTLKCKLGTGGEVRALSACPNLRCAFFELSDFDQEAGGQRVALLHLERLAISDGGMGRSECVLALLDLPKLRYLTLCLRDGVGFDYFNGSPTLFPHLESLRLEVVGIAREWQPITHLLIRTPNIRKLTLNRPNLFYDLPDMTARLESGSVFADESVRQYIDSDPFLPQLHTLVLLGCPKLSVGSTELKNFMFQWATCRCSDGGRSIHLALRTDCVEKRFLTRLKSSWSGEVGPPTQGDLVDVTDDRWLMNDSYAIFNL